MAMKCLSACTLVVGAVCAALGSQPVQVSTRSGAVLGSRAAVEGAKASVDTFYNIPYAQPPVGPLRFHKPVSSLPWTGTLNATAIGNICPQRPTPYLPNPPFKASEDCLNLNVFTPQVANNSGPLPVMFWIHGGGYYLGAGNWYTCSQLAAQGVVVVTINYRLGALGFLSTEDGASVGNYGLWDQILALQWVRDSISAFNGNPNDVTIFGQSAGSGSVSLLLVAREARGLFHKAIMESGVALSPWAIARPGTTINPRKNAVTLATRLGCDVSDSSRLVACLRTKDPLEIVNISTKMELENHNRLTFKPVTETLFGQYGIFSAVPEAVLENGWFNNVPVIRGFNSLEMSDPSLDPDNDGFTLAEFKNLTLTNIHEAVQADYQVDADTVLDLMMKAYLTTPNPSPQDLRAAYFKGLRAAYFKVSHVTTKAYLISLSSSSEDKRAVYFKFRTDYEFIAPTYKEQGLWYKAGGKTEYLYRFNYRSANRQNPRWEDTKHGDELSYVFGAPVGNWSLPVPNFVSSWTDDDRRMSQEMMTMWSNFAKYGNPTPSGSGLPSWLPWTQSNPSYLDIDVTSTMASADDTAGVTLINDVIPKLQQAAVVG